MFEDRHPDMKPIAENLNVLSRVKTTHFERPPERSEINFHLNNYPRPPTPRPRPPTPRPRPPNSHRKPSTLRHEMPLFDLINYPMSHLPRPSIPRHEKNENNAPEELTTATAKFHSHNNNRQHASSPPISHHPNRRLWKRRVKRGIGFGLRFPTRQIPRRNSFSGLGRGQGSRSRSASPSRTGTSTVANRASNTLAVRSSSSLLQRGFAFVQRNIGSIVSWVFGLSSLSYGIYDQFIKEVEVVYQTLGVRSDQKITEEFISNMTMKAFDSMMDKYAPGDENEVINELAEKFPTSTLGEIRKLRDMTEKIAIAFPDLFDMTLVNPNVLPITYEKNDPPSPSNSRSDFFKTRKFSRKRRSLPTKEDGQRSGEDRVQLFVLGSIFSNWTESEEKFKKFQLTRSLKPETKVYAEEVFSSFLNFDIPAFFQLLVKNLDEDLLLGPDPDIGIERVFKGNSVGALGITIDELITMLENLHDLKFLGGVGGEEEKDQTAIERPSAGGEKGGEREGHQRAIGDPFAVDEEKDREHEGHEPAIGDPFAVHQKDREREGGKPADEEKDREHEGHEPAIGDPFAVHQKDREREGGKPAIGDPFPVSSGRRGRAREEDWGEPGNEEPFPVGSGEEGEEEMGVVRGAADEKSANMTLDQFIKKYENVTADDVEIPRNGKSPLMEGKDNSLIYVMCLLTMFFIVN